MINRPKEPEPPREPDFPHEPSSGVEEAHRVLLFMAGVVAVPVILVMLVWKGFVPALVVAFIALGVWATFAEFIPSESDLQEFSRERTPAETWLMIVIGLVVAAGLLIWFAAS